MNKTHLNRLVFFILTIINFSVVAEKFQTIVFYSSLPPYEFTDAKGNAAGVGIEYLNELFEKTDLTPIYQFNSIARGVLLLHEGKIDFTTVISPNSSIYDAFYVSKLPVFIIDIGVIREKITPQLFTIDQLNGQAFAALRNASFYFIENQLQQSLSQHLRLNVDDISTGIQLVNTQKIPFLLSYDIPDAHTLPSNLAFDLLLSAPVHLVISKQHKNAILLMNKINKVMTVK